MSQNALEAVIGLLFWVFVVYGWVKIVRGAGRFAKTHPDETINAIKFLAARLRKR